MKEKVKEYLPFVIFLLVILLLKTFVVTTIRVNGTSMVPTLQSNDIMILDEIHYRFSEVRRFDIGVVAREKNNIIKRVIGLPGEKIEYRDNVLYINDEVVEDIYNSTLQEDFLCILGESEYFVMGDNRADSLDSRMIGPVERNKILGRAIFTIFPFHRWGSSH